MGVESKFAASFYAQVVSASINVIKLLFHLGIDLLY